MVLLNKKCIFEHYREFQERKTLLIDIIFATKISLDLFRAAPYMLMLVLHKDVPFHWNNFLPTLIFALNMTAYPSEGKGKKQIITELPMTNTLASYKNP